MPYGESFVSEHTTSTELPYLFNGKPLDEETGLYYYGARYFTPSEAVWYGVDPLAEEYYSVGSYVYCFGNPTKFIDPNGELPIFVNGRVSNDGERASSSYWDPLVVDVVSRKLNYPKEKIRYVDGDKGTWASDRYKGGYAQAKNDAIAIFNKLERNDEGKIIEAIQVFTHSRGSAFGNGYIDGLRECIEANEKLFADPDKVIELVVHMAPHQSNSINIKQSSTTTFAVSHYGDVLSGNDAKGDVFNIHSRGMEHGNASFMPELHLIINTYLEGGNKSQMFDKLKSKYKDYDHFNSRKSKVTYDN